ACLGGESPVAPRRSPRCLLPPPGSCPGGRRVGRASGHRSERRGGTASPISVPRSPVSSDSETGVSEAVPGGRIRAAVRAVERPAAWELPLQPGGWTGCPGKCVKGGEVTDMYRPVVLPCTERERPL